MAESYDWQRPTTAMLNAPHGEELQAWLWGEAMRFKPFSEIVSEKLYNAQRQLRAVCLLLGDLWFRFNLDTWNIDVEYQIRTQGSEPGAKPNKYRVSISRHFFDDENQDVLNRCLLDFLRQALADAVPGDGRSGTGEAPDPDAGAGED